MRWDKDSVQVFSANRIYFTIYYCWMVVWLTADLFFCQEVLGLILKLLLDIFIFQIGSIKPELVKNISDNLHVNVSEINTLFTVEYLSLLYVFI